MAVDVAAERIVEFPRHLKKKDLPESLSRGPMEVTVRPDRPSWPYQVYVERYSLETVVGVEPTPPLRFVHTVLPFNRPSCVSQPVCLGVDSVVQAGGRDWATEVASIYIYMDGRYFGRDELLYINIQNGDGRVRAAMLRTGGLHSPHSLAGLKSSRNETRKVAGERRGAYARTYEEHLCGSHPQSSWHVFNHLRMPYTRSGQVCLYSLNAPAHEISRAVRRRKPRADCPLFVSSEF